MQKRFRWGKIAVALGGLAAVALTGYYLMHRAKMEPEFVQKGVASWYGPGFHGQETASGEIYDQNDLTAAHRKLPLGTMATVINLENGRQVEVRINDRGPYVRGRILDLSKAAARKLGMLDDGTVPVRIEVTTDQLEAADGN